MSYTVEVGEKNRKLEIRNLKYNIANVKHEAFLLNITSPKLTVT